LGGSPHQRRIIMANVELKTGVYTVPAKKSQEFTFWWGSNAEAYPPDSG
jgi:hypothetical protein